MREKKQSRRTFLKTGAISGSLFFLPRMLSGISSPTKDSMDTNVAVMKAVSVRKKAPGFTNPASLEKARGVHPRLFLDDKRVVELREAIKSSHAKIWAEFLIPANRYVKSEPPVYRENGAWQRNVGNIMPILAMAWLMTGQREYLDKAREWALTSCSYPTWGRNNGAGLEAGHLFTGLGIVYDWCYHDLDEDSRRTIRDTLAKRAFVMLELAKTGNLAHLNSFVNNHLMVKSCGIGIAGLAVFDEVEEASQWIGFSLDRFQRIMATHGDDGVSSEGAGYWSYGVEYMLKFMHLARELLDVNLYDNEWWRNTATYCQYIVLPKNSWVADNCVVDIADCRRMFSFGPDFQLRHDVR